jgi:LDH2 family malate/lactate/ureidoglycolate dehydrogenase
MTKKENNINETSITVADLSDRLKSILNSLKVPRHIMTMILDYTITVEKMGITSHGIEFFLQIVNKIKSGHFSYRKDTLIEGNRSYHLFNSSNNIGIVSAINAIKTGIRYSKKYGIHTLLLRNCNTFGSASYYGFFAAEQGIITISLANAPASMKMDNSKYNLLGTNPLSIAIPAKNSNHIIFDIAMSKIAKSKLRRFLKSGEKVPIGWGLDSDGNDSDDAKSIINGSLIPFGGYKSIGLAIMVDILAGVLSGSNYLNQVNKWGSGESQMNAGQLFILIDPNKIYGSDFLESIEEYKSIIQASSKDGTQVRLPGMRTMSNLKRNKEIITISKEIEIEIQSLLDSLDSRP